MNNRSPKTMLNTTVGTNLLPDVASALFVDSKLPAKTTSSSSATIASSREAEACYDSIGGRKRSRETVSDATAPAAGLVMAPSAAGADLTFPKGKEYYKQRTIYNVPPNDAQPSKSCLRGVNFLRFTRELTFKEEEPAVELPTCITKPKLKLCDIDTKAEDGVNLLQVIETLKAHCRTHKESSMRYKKERDLLRAKATKYKAEAIKYRQHREVCRKNASHYRNQRETYRNQRETLQKENAELTKELNAALDQLQRLASARQCHTILYVALGKTSYQHDNKRPLPSTLSFQFTF